MPAFSQNPIPVPGNIKLLAGYVHVPARGIDTAVGKIVKENGLEITYDIGRFAGNLALGAVHRKESLLWSKEIEVNGRSLLLAYRQGDIVHATFDSHANFTAVIKSNEDLADFLLMIGTYGSPDNTRNKRQD